jgi:hypothetical protein
LIALPAERAANIVKELNEKGILAAVEIGEVLGTSDSAEITIVD